MVLCENLYRKCLYHAMCSVVEIKAPFYIFSYHINDRNLIKLQIEGSDSFGNGLKPLSMIIFHATFHKKSVIKWITEGCLSVESVKICNSGFV